MKYEDRAIKAAKWILRMRQDLVDQGKREWPDNTNKQEWHRHDGKQAFRDSLEAMERAGLIGSYNLATGEVTPGPKKKGELVFVPTGPKVSIS